jgi:hypothetical protein
MLNIYYETPKGIQLHDKSYVKLEEAMPVVNTLSILSDVFSIEVKNTFTSEVFYFWRRSFMLKDIAGSCISKEEIQEKYQDVWNFYPYADSLPYTYEWSVEKDKDGKTMCVIKKERNLKWKTEQNFLVVLFLSFLLAW